VVTARDSALKDAPSRPYLAISGLIFVQGNDVEPNLILFAKQLPMGREYTIEDPDDVR
jgi:hypothetical protein